MDLNMDEAIHMVMLKNQLFSLPSIQLWNQSN